MSEPLTEKELARERRYAEAGHEATGHVTLQFLATIDARDAEIATMRGVREALVEANAEVVALEKKLELVDCARILIPHSRPDKPVYYPDKLACHENCQRCSLDAILKGEKVV